MGRPTDEPAMTTRRDIDWLFLGRHFDRELSFCVLDGICVTSSAFEPRRNDGRRWPVARTCTDYALGQALRARGRQAWESLCLACRSVLAGR
ncbi:hypothetical protein BN2475_750003 [Paraburkholderia ribeironis]|uniref:Uncharacterized protein n=1 Tax=Paraburkholderia ribeironis TaxID=1247936 RepID=A0A1N7SJ82_9BURK|nr:hypothetical protein BN2475_750003 [Paraburkholderia ribeironis]